jgi:hypothetical protein
VVFDVARRPLLELIQQSGPSLPSLMHGTAEDHAHALRSEKLRLSELWYVTRQASASATSRFMFDMRG